MADQTIHDEESTAEKELAILLNKSQAESYLDIDETLNYKAKKNNLSKRNVKNLIKNILIDDDVVTMLRQTLIEDKDANCLYEPKLTRAKIKEMLKAYPPTDQQWSINQQKSIISECRLLLEKEFAEDEEDDEYHPDKILDDDDDEFDDVECKFTDINKSFKAEDANGIANEIVMEFNDKETIGMRTRSKLSLNDTPLEIIEQAFIPPDITEDMYDSACENDEWMEFLKEFTKPLESVQNYDLEDDPEYNVLCDIDFTNVDKEEFREDKSVKITRKEYNDLMDELTEFMESYVEFDTDTALAESVNEKNTIKSKNCKPLMLDYTNTDNTDWKINNTTFSTNDLPIIDVASTNNLQPNINEQLNKSNMIHLTLPIPNLPVENIQQCEDNLVEKNTDLLQSVSRNDNPTCIDIDGMTSKQTILLRQQLAQHIQLMTQSYMLCSMTFKFKKCCRPFIKKLEEIKNICTDKIYMPVNIDASLTFIRQWNEQKMYDIDYCWNSIELPKHIKEFMAFYDKPVFIYPKLLPVKTFDIGLKTCAIGPSEEKFLVLKIHDEYTKLKESPNTRAMYKKQNLSDMMPVLLRTVRKRWIPHRKLSDLKQLVTARKNALKMNVLKNYLEHNKIDDVIHKVSIESLYEKKRLYKLDTSQFPYSWKGFIKNLKKRNN